jgi:hypothetical protein
MVDEPVATRDQIASELADFYPVAVERLSKLFATLVASNYETSVVNTQLPDGAAGLESAELLAKGQAGQPLDRSDASVLECRLSPWLPHMAARWPADPRFG